VTSDDAALIEAWRAGNPRAADTLLRRHFDGLWRFFRNKVDDEAEELIQRTLTALLKARAQFRGDASFRTYLFSVARSELFRFYRQRERDAARFDFDEVSVADMGASPSSVVARREHERALRIALRRIPLDSQVVLEWHYWENLKMTEIAEALDVPLGTAKSRLRRAREQLESALQETIASRETLTSTLENLDRWASQLREAVSR
jgi:RNA polymerase sigma-70 factor (ECF subfamily)